MLIEQDGFPEIAVSANSPWAAERNAEGLKVHIMMATEDSVENGGNGLYLSAIKAIVAGK